MLSFAVEFPVKHEHPSANFLRAVQDWVLGSPHTRFSAEEFAGIDARGEWSARKGDERLDVLRASSRSDESAAAKYTRNDSDLQWVTTIAFSRTTSDSWVSIRVSCESSHPAVRLPPAKKPVVVRTLMSTLGSGSDGLLGVSDAPYRLEQMDVDIAMQLISGRAGCRLPIVYTSSSFDAGYLVDTDRLASDLAGMAHVVVEPNRAFSLRLKAEVGSENVYGGTVGVYWPEGAGRRSFFIGREFESSDEVRRAIAEEITKALTNRRPLDRCTWAAVQRQVSQRAFEALKADGSQEVDRYIEEFDKERLAEAERLADAEREIGRLRADVRMYESRRPLGSGLTIHSGPERELYPGEMGAVVREAVQDAATRAHDSRRKHVLSSVLAVNPASEEPSRFRNELKELLRGSTTIDSRIRRGLEQLGFEVSEDGKHYKLVFQGDGRYTFSFPKSGSDHRGGLNAASEITRRLFG